MDITYPDVKVTLVGTDGNAFAILGAVRKAIKEKHGGIKSRAWLDQAAKCENYEALLVFVMQSVEVD